MITALEDPDLDAVSLGKEHMFTAAEAIVWVAAAGLEVAARAAAVARPLTNPNNIRPLIRKVSVELELGLIRTHMAQKPMLRVEVCARCVARESSSIQG